MKKLKKSLLSLLVGTSIAATVVTASCTSTPKYTIDFSVDGGESISAQTLKQGEEYSLPTPTKSGYAFEGWYTSADFSGAAITSITATENTTIYAKWAKLYTISLDANGGTLATTTIEAKAGVKVSELLANSTPTKANVKFAGWYLNNKELAADYVMPETEVKLVAKYTSTVKAEYYLENLDGTYEKTTADLEVLEGTQYTSDYTVTGYSEVTKEDTVSSVTAGDNKTIKQYYDRNTYEVTFNTNYPDESVNDEITASYKFGTKFELPTDVSCKGYALVGWATSEDGEVVIPVNEMEARLYKAEASMPEGLEVTDKVTYYAVWSKGYTNMFDGEDLIYIINDEVYLERAGFVFKGEYLAKKNKFTFYDVNEDILLEGKVNDDGTYSYSSEVRNAQSYTLFVPGQGLDSTINIYFDLYNGVKYSNTAVGVSNGTYTINEDNTFHVVFTDGEMEGKTIDFKVGYVKSTPAFQIRDEKAVALGELSLFYVNGSVLDINANATVVLDGYGSTTIGSSSFTYKLDLENETLVLTSAATSTTASQSYTFKIIEVNDMKGIIQYYEAYDHTYTNGSETLVLDGMGKAKYESATDEGEGYYTLSQTKLGQVVVSFTTEFGSSYKFVISTTQATELLPATYSFKAINEAYAEYYYMNSTSTYYYPLLVTVDSENAELYAYCSDKTFALISSGKYVDNGDGTYTYTADKYSEVKEGVSPLTSVYDLTKVKSFTYGIYEGSSYIATYWYSWTDTDGVLHDSDEYGKLKAVYTNKTTDSDTGAEVTYTMTFIGNSMIYSNGETTSSFEYSKDSNGYIVVTLSGKKFTFELDNETMTFKPVETPIYQYLYENGSTVQTEYFLTDYYGKLTYNYVVVEDDKEVSKTVTGEITKTGKTSVSGFIVSKFVSTDGSIDFEFINLYSTSNSYVCYFSPYKSDAYTFTVPGENSFTITIDGYGFYAVVAFDEDSSSNMYYAFDEEAGVLTLSTGSASYVFDVDMATKNAYQRGSEARSYLLFDNSTFMGSYITLDGHGKAKVWKLVEGAQAFIDENGTYEIDYDALEINITYMDGTQKITLNGTISTTTISGSTYYTYVIAHKDVASVYVNENDMTVLEIDEYGYATYYDTEGIVTDGKVVFISDDLLYFVNEAEDDASIFIYNAENGTMSRSNNKLRGYYSKDLDMLYFSEYGFVRFNGERYYYFVNSDGDCLVYEYDSTNAKANRYGYVETEFGKFTDIKEYKGITFYVNNGYAVQFNRPEDKLSKWVIKNGEETLQVEKLYFAPTGTEFSVNGTLVIGGTNYTCTVVRYFDEADNTYKMYAKYNSFVFNITVTYGGVDDNDESLSTFDVTSIVGKTELGSYDWAYAQYKGTSKVNKWGSVYLITEYDEDGNKVGDSYANSDFTSIMNLVDSNGNLINLNKSAYTLSTATASNGSTVNIVEASTVGSDGYTYLFRFQLVSYNNAYYAYIIYCVREQSLTDGDYTVKTKQVIVYQEATTYAGQIMSYALYKGEEELKNVTATTLTDGYYFVVNDIDSETGAIKNVTYIKYVINTKEIEATAVAPYDTVKFTVMDTTTYTSADGKYTLVVSNNEVVAYYVDGESKALIGGYLSANGYVVGTYDKTTGALTVYNAKVDSGKIVVTDITGTTIFSTDGEVFVGVDEEGQLQYVFIDGLTDFMYTVDSTTGVYTVSTANGYTVEGSVNAQGKLEYKILKLKVYTADKKGYILFDYQTEKVIGIQVNGVVYEVASFDDSSDDYLIVVTKDGKTFKAEYDENDNLVITDVTPATTE